jgi:hypothetical protein
MTSKATTGGRVAAALVYGVPYMGLFIAFTYYLDRFAYRRWQRKTGGQPTKR